MNEIKQLVAVYGTLKRGFGNNRLLDNQKFCGEFKTEPEFTMLSLGGFPGIIEKGDTSIHCEVFEVDNNETLRRLDMLEGYPRFYNRKTVKTPWGEAWIYFLNKNKYNEKTYPVVEEGFWNYNY